MKYNTQELLFNETNFVLSEPKLAEFDVPQEFVERGYCKMTGLKTVEDAKERLDQFVQYYQPINHPVWNSIAPRLQLSKVDLIPDCGDSIETTCQALHFDYGQPLMGEDQSMYALVGLYIPLTTKLNQQARTRVVNLEELLAQKSLGSEQEVEAKLTSYIQEHGDGWNDEHTDRLACFSRVVDGAAGKSELVHEYDKTMAQWMEEYNGACGVDAEYAFYQSLGYDIGALEDRVHLKPGELLIIDNFRCIHGRVGEREKQEMAQFLYGVESASGAEISAYRSWLVEHMA